MSAAWAAPTRTRTQYTYCANCGATAARRHFASHVGEALTPLGL
jgi:hypothetical protein